MSDSRMRPAKVLSVLAFAVILAGCLRLEERQTVGGVYVENRSGVPIEVRIRGIDDWRSIGSLEPGESEQVIRPGLLHDGSRSYARDGCTTETMVAIGPNGEEVARHGPGLCEKDRWIVGPPSSSPASPQPY